MIGNINKVHSDFYYVKVDGKTIECKIREILKKEQAEIYVGDNVRIEEYDSNSNQAVITEILERKNFISRPAIANIDQIVVITTLKHPHVDMVQLNRYLTHSRLHNIKAVICVNKHDLIKHEAEKNKFISIYKPLGYEIVFTSALNLTGINELKEILKSKISVFCGASGVGKSSILNAINPCLDIRTQNISKKTARGIHTTRHTEIIEIKYDEDNLAKVADTPGFTNLKFNNILPEEVGQYFDDISNFSKECYFNDCIHTEETGCNVIKNLDKIETSRYKSYKAFLDEAFDHKETLSNQSDKIEESFKILDANEDKKVKILKLGSKAREMSRKNKKQKINVISTLEDAYYNNEDYLK